MSDTAAVAAPTDGGVPIEAPASKPAPVENRAPDAPSRPEADKPSTSTDEALRKAIEKHRAEPKDKADAAPKQERPAETKPAPKEGADERGKAAPAAKEGGEVENRPTRERAADGKFATRQQEGEQAAAAPQQTGEPQKAKAPRPTAWRLNSADEEAAWDATPDVIRGKVEAREREVADGIRQYRERLDPLKPYFEAADKNGTTLHEAVERYSSMENMLRTDIVRGFSEIARELGMDIRRIAEHIVGQTPEQTRVAGTFHQMQSENERLNRQLQQMQQRQQSFEEEQRYNQTITAVERFAAEHPRLDELAEPIAEKLRAGYTLEDAYYLAERSRPAAAEERPPLAPVGSAEDARTVPARRPSVAGAPSPGSSQVKQPPASSTEEALRRAFAKHA